MLKPSLLYRMALSDAKGDVDDRVRDLAASERELEKADFDLRYKTHEAKIVNKAAVAKRTEVGEVLATVPLSCEFTLSEASVQHGNRLRLPCSDALDCKTASVAEYSKGSCTANPIMLNLPFSLL